MKHCIASGTAHAVSHKIKISCLKKKTGRNPFSRVKFLFSQGHTDILAGSSGHSLHSYGSGQVQTVASTEHGKDKFNFMFFMLMVPCIIIYSMK